MYLQFISKLLQGSKNMVAFCRTVQKSYSLFCVESLDWGVDFKIRISSIASQEKGNKILCTANEEVGATTFNSQ